VRRSLSLLLASVLAIAVPPSIALAQTIQEMAGQMIVVGFKGDGANDASVKAVRQAVEDGRIGGVMYLKINVASKAAVTAMNEAFRAAAPDGLPPFLTLDQEGGAVERLTEAIGFRELPNAEAVARSDSPAEAEKLYERMAKDIRALGFSVNFGPVADMNVNRNNQIIAKFGRAFSADPEVVTQYDRAFIEAHHSAGLVTALKHFPGHGSSTGDSHAGFVDITKTWKPEELEPYKALISGGYKDFVMVGHLYQGEIQDADDKRPASLSPEWIEGKLRGELGFDGAVISDDLEMGAIRKLYSLEQTVIGAVNAGTDVLLFSNTAYNDPKLPDRILDVLLSESNRDPAFAKRIENSYRRIRELKGRIGH